MQMPAYQKYQQEQYPAVTNSSPAVYTSQPYYQQNGRFGLRRESPPNLHQRSSSEMVAPSQPLAPVTVQTQPSLQA
jgi:hypothetical protein